MENKFKNSPKDVKTSIRNKYNRRLVNLSFVVVDFIQHAEDRLDKAKSGNIYKREQIEDIVEKCRQLSALLPCQNDDVAEDFVSESGLATVLDEASRKTEMILKEGREWFENLSEEEWKELREYADQSDGI